MNEPTKAECLSNARSAWKLYEDAFERAAFYALINDTLKAQFYNHAKQTYEGQARAWEERAAKATK